jgi:hypothetical protein
MEGDKSMINRKLYVEYLPLTGETELLIENKAAFEIPIIESDEKIVRDVSYLYSSFFEYIDETMFKLFIYRLSVSLNMSKAVKYNKEEDVFYLDDEFLKSYVTSNRNIIEMQIESHRNFLYATDWYVTRYAETGVAIPELIKEQRAEKRLLISQLSEQLNLLPE